MKGVFVVIFLLMGVFGFQRGAVADEKLDIADAKYEEAARTHKEAEARAAEKSKLAEARAREADKAEVEAEDSQAAAKRWFVIMEDAPLDSEAHEEATEGWMKAREKAEKARKTAKKAREDAKKAREDAKKAEEVAEKASKAQEKAKEAQALTYVANEQEREAKKWEDAANEWFWKMENAPPESQAREEAKEEWMKAKERAKHSRRSAETLSENAKKAREERDKAWQELLTALYQDWERKLKKVSETDKKYLDAKRAEEKAKHAWSIKYSDLMPPEGFLSEEDHKLWEARQETESARIEAYREHLDAERAEEEAREGAQRFSEEFWEEIKKAQKAKEEEGPIGQAPAGIGTTVTVSYDSPKPFPAGLSIGIEPFVEWAWVPSVGIGTVITTGGEELFLGKSPDPVTVYGAGVKVAYEFDRGGPLEDTRVRFNYYWGWGDAENSASEPPGGNPVAIAYNNFAPNGSTGLFLAETGLSATQMLEFDYHRFALDLERDFPVNHGFTLTPRIQLNYSWQEQNHTGVLQSSTFADIRSEQNQEVEEQYFGVGFGAYASRPVTPMIKAGFGVLFDLFYREADLDSSQRNMCGICAAPEDNFTSNNNDSDEGLTWGVDLTAGVEFEDVLPLPRVSVYIFGYGSYIDERALVRNPKGGELFAGGRPTHLEAEPAWDAGFSVGLQYNF